MHRSNAIDICDHFPRTLMDIIIIVVDKNILEHSFRILDVERHILKITDSV